jgi:hypothetical protein
MLKKNLFSFCKTTILQLVSSIARQSCQYDCEKTLFHVSDELSILTYVREHSLQQGHVVTPASRRTSDRFVKPAIPPTIVSPGGPPIIAPNPNTAPQPGSPMDIAKT